MFTADNRDSNIIACILEYCKQVDAAFEKFGRNIDDFFADPVFRNAVSMPIFQIGELTGDLSNNFKEQHKSEIPWKLIRGMRNRFAHNYLGMDIQMIWDSATIDIPAMKEFCCSILSEIDNGISSDGLNENSSQNLPIQHPNGKSRSSLDERISKARSSREATPAQEQSQAQTKKKINDELLE